jgi:hypothetical protein
MSSLTSKLLDLPSELLSLVVERYVVDYGLDEALQLRLVCRMYFPRLPPFSHFGALERSKQTTAYSI